MGIRSLVAMQSHRLIYRGAIMELKTFGERLYWARRKYAKLTQQQLRDRMQEEFGVDIGRNYISQLETDAGAQPTLSVLTALAGALRVSLDYLVGLSKSHVPAQGEEVMPQYFSPEADEVAQLIDAMRPGQRTLLLEVARNMASPAVQRRHMLAEMRDVLDSVEQELGIEARMKVEKSLRRKWLAMDSDS